MLKSPGNENTVYILMTTFQYPRNNEDHVIMGIGNGDNAFCCCGDGATE